MVVPTSLSPDQVEALAETLASQLRGGWDDADARDAAGFLAPVVATLVAQAAVERERALRERVEAVCDRWEADALRYVGRATYGPPAALAVTKAVRTALSESMVAR